MQLFILEKIKNGDFYFYENDIVHITKALRKQVGDQIRAIDNENKIYLLEITALNPFRTKLIEQVNVCNEYDFEINLFVGIIRKNNFEFIIEKATELHVNKIIPVYFARSQRTNVVNLTRSKIIINESIKQSNRQSMVTICEPIDFEQMQNMINNNEIKIVAYENEKTQSLNDLKIIKPKIINLIIGPEGGFEISEIEKLSKFNNTHFVKLTKSILRTETACFYLLSNVINKWG